MTSLRAFLALDFDTEGKAHLAAHLRHLRAASWASQVRWVSPENLHLTLRFLGEVTPAQAAQYANAFRDGLSTLDDLDKLQLRVSGPSLFPSTARPRIIACLTASQPALNVLAALAESCALGVGLAAESRPFQGHITLGRLREQRPTERIALAEAPQAVLRPSAITLYRSRLHPGGPTYSPLATFSLGSQI
jgi:2'-5' RNA ligase